MAFPFRKILAPMDLEENSVPALRIAENLARQSDGIVYLLHVVVPEEFALLQEKYRPWETGGRDLAAACKVAQSKLEQTARERMWDGVRREVLTRAGDPAETVLQLEKDLGVDVVVMGFHGRRDPSDLLPGSIAEQVVRNSPCPVLTVRSR